jgi:hypothetical protein
MGGPVSRNSGDLTGIKPDALGHHVDEMADVLEAGWS